MANSSLYPPIVAYSMPAFAVEDVQDSQGSVSTEGVRIYFALSSYNRRADFSKAHFTVRYQQNNANALREDDYPAQIKITEVREVTAEEDPVIAATAARYYITIYDSDLKEGFLPDVTYKVQIRFTKDMTTSNPQGLSYFATHTRDFSEWSTVCCIRGINKPNFFIVGLEDTGGEYDSDEVEMILASVDSNFLVSFTPGNKEEPLRRWRVQLLSSEKELLADSDWNSYDSYNNMITEWPGADNVGGNGSVYFEAILPYQMTNEENYWVYITIETKNGYQEIKKVPFSVAVYSTDVVPGDITLQINEDEGYAEVAVVGNASDMILNLTLRRSSSKSNFTIWEDIANTEVVNEALDWHYCDFTIESGVFYRYGVQTRDNRGRRGMLKLSNIEMGEFDDAFLVESGESLSNAKQLKLRYDFKISNFTRTVAESKTDTIGSQFPFVRRNGNMYYRTLQCTGLITAFMDGAHLFTNKAKLYNNNQNRYNEIRQPIEEATNSYDYTYEREFRKAVEEFLHNGKVKLFKSLQEGNILVKVMTVSLTPKQELGRLLYEFSATLVEVDEPTILNFDHYGLLHIGTYNSNITFTSAPLLGRLFTDTPYDAETDLMDLIRTKYNYRQSDGEKIVEDFYLDYLRLEIESPPYLIRTGPSPVVINDYDGTQIDNYTPGNPSMDTQSEVADIVVGWLFIIDGEKILIEPPNNIYELKGNNIYISSQSSIIPMAPTQVQIDMVTTLMYSQDTSRIASKKIFRKINGQYINTFTASENIIDTIWYRYYVDYYAEGGQVEEGQDTFYIQLISILSIDVDAEPGTILYARSDASDEPTKFIVNETGLLSLDPGSEKFTIKELYVKGMRIDARYLTPKYDLIPMEDRDDTWSIRDRGDMFTTTYDGTTLKRFNDLHDKGSEKPDNPEWYDYYTANGKTYMYYQGDWYPTVINPEDEFEHNTIFEIECPTDAMIFYYAQVEKGIY